MYSFNRVRSMLATTLIFTLLLSTFVLVSAQEVTPEPTEDMMMSQMSVMEGECLQGMAGTIRDNMMMGMGMEMTMEAPMMEMTDEVGMDMTDEPTMEMTDEMGMPMTGVSCLFAILSGAAEVPGPGDEDGFGVAFVSINPSTGDVCYEVTVANITLPATGMHIHVNSAGVSGDVVVPFPTAPDAEGMAMGCTNTSVEGLAESIVTRPEGYYVNVHNEDFPAGAVRGQLMDWNMMDMSMLDMTNMDMTQMMQTVEMMSVGNMGTEMMDMTPEATPSS
jgi:hypothetical protein